MLQSSTNNGPGFKNHPQHVITLEKSGSHDLAVLNGVVLAASDQGILMQENKYSPVIYFPTEDVNMDLASASEHTTYCPFKGTASYLSFGGVENIAWKYDDPYDEMLEIKGYIAFYQNKLDHKI
jgi:uncharacterized protein (DUF427 family)